jgi:hypothetical protein
MTQKLSKAQEEALEQITKLTDWKIKHLGLVDENCWFIQGELSGITYRTLQTLFQKGYLQNKYVRFETYTDDYYRWSGEDVIE